MSSLSPMQFGAYRVGDYPDAKPQLTDRYPTVRSRPSTVKAAAAVNGSGTKPFTVGTPGAN